MFTAIVHVLTTGCAWRHLPTEFDVSQATAHRRFVAWTQAGLRRRLHGRYSTGLGEKAALDWSRAVADAANVRAKEGPAERPQPGRRGKPGAPLHVLTDAAGLPLAVAVSAANTHDSLALIPLVQAVPAIRSRRGPRRRPDELHAGKGYDYEHLRSLAAR